MSNYTKSTNFAAKDSLPSGNANKVVKGTEINTEFDNIATAIATKADLNSPTLVTPNLGTPSAAVLTNATGLPIFTGVSGLGTGVATALAINVGSAGAPVVNGGALGTPSSGTVTNLTGTASININGTVGATTPTTGAFTTLTASGNVTLSGGTANGVLYLNGSKVATSGSELTFDGNTLTNTAGGVVASSAVTITGSTNAVKTFYLSNYADAAANWNYIRSSSGVFEIAASGSNSLAFAASGSEQMRLTSTGLGIGTSSPWSQLTVGAGGTANPASTVTFHKTTASEYRLKLTAATFNSDGAWLGLGFGYSDNYMKAAIIAEAKDSNARTNLHFALNDAASSANASLSDSKMVLTYSGNLGLGVTPSAWNTAGGTRAFEFNNNLGSGSVAGWFGSVNLMNNAIFSATGGGTMRYVATGVATQYQQSAGSHAWYTAPSGTAGNAITFTQAMTLDASGNLIVPYRAVFGQTLSGDSVLQVASAYGGLRIGYNSTNVNYFDGDTQIFRNSAGTTERARITSSGDLITNVNGTAPTLSTNSTMSFELTSNTSLKIVVRGTDGVTRSASLLLV